MATEHDEDLDDVPFRVPLPPDDRLWRHPSELLGELALVAARPKRRRRRAPATPPG